MYTARTSATRRMIEAANTSMPIVRLRRAADLALARDNGPWRIGARPVLDWRGTGFDRAGRLRAAILPLGETGACLADTLRLTDGTGPVGRLLLTLGAWFGDIAPLFLGDIVPLTLGICCCGRLPLALEV